MKIAMHFTRISIALSLLVVLTTTFPPSLRALEFQDGVVIQSTRKDGTKVGLVIDRNAIQSAPQWSPKNGPPPLSIMEAYRLVLDWARGEYVRYDDVVVSQISLVRWQRWGESNRWYYRFDLQPVIDGNALHGPGNWAAVLMDGSVIGSRELR